MAGSRGREDPGVSPVGRTAAVDALAAAYGNVTAAVDGLGEAGLMRPSLCAGWAVADVLYHQLTDARRALRGFATPADGPADLDDVSYWRLYSPRAGQPDGPGSDEAAAHARYVRISASAYPPGTLAWDWRETAGAACRAAAACPHELVATQGHVLRTADFTATLAVEAAVHFLDLSAGLPAAPPPQPAPLALVRRVLDGLLGRPVPVSWDDRTYALKGTGREPLTGEERRQLGPLADQFPLFG
jgi:uncharacterized protein (TIGR03083 family)